MKLYRNNLTDSFKAVANVLKGKIKFVQPGGVNSNSAQFFWLDLREFLPSDPTPKDELRLRDEMRDKIGVKLLPGTTMACKWPGYFRLCFTAYKKDEVVTAATTMRDYLLMSCPVDLKNDTGKAVTNVKIRHTCGDYVDNYHPRGMAADKEGEIKKISIAHYKIGAQYKNGWYIEFQDGDDLYKSSDGFDYCTLAAVDAGQTIKLSFTMKEFSVTCPNSATPGKVTINKINK